jgi:hypothetical protein
VRPYLKNLITKRGCGVDLGVGTEFKPQYCKKTKKKNKEKKIFLSRI